MFKHLGRFTAKHPWFVCAAWLVAGGLLACAAPCWDTRIEDDDVRFVPERFTSVRAYHLLQQAFPQEVYASNLILAVERDDRPLTDADYALVDRFIAELETLRDRNPDLKLGKIDSYRDELIGYRLKSGDGQCTLIKVSLGTPFLALATGATVDRAQEVVQRCIAERQCIAEAGDDPPRVYTTGSAAIGHDLIKACGDSLEHTSLATVVLVIVVLFMVYRAPVLALIPLVSIGVSVWVALKLLALLTLLPGVHLVSISKIFVIVILYGAGTDYCLFLVSRFREELHNGSDAAAAIVDSVSSVGAALAASAGTVIVGLGLMGLAEFAKVRYAGPAIALSLGVALAASLTLTPALLRLLGRFVFWPCRAPAPARARLAREAPRLGFWDWISHFVARRPLLVWASAVLILLPLVVIGLRVKPNYCATGELHPSAECLQGLGAIGRHFTPGETGPITILLVAQKDWNSHDGRLEIDHLCRGLSRLDNVAEIRCLTRPLGMTLPQLWPDPENQSLWNRFLFWLQPAVNGFYEECTRKAVQAYVAEIPAGQAPARFVTRLDLVLKSDPFTQASHDTLHVIQTWLRTELPRTAFIGCPVQAECYGLTANAQDLAELIEGDRVRVNAFVLGAIFVILVMLVRRLWLASYLLITVLFSYFAALGATVLAGIFWTGAPLPHLEWRVPFFLFTILVAVGEDYNILLVARALEEARRHGPVEGMRRALAKTGGAITSCGMIMAGTFATLMLGGLGTLLQIGFALAFGVLIDTFVVRPFLVPAFAMLCARVGWVVQPMPPAATPPRLLPLDADKQAA